MRVHWACSYGVVPFSSICAFRKPRPCTPPGREPAFNPGVPARRPTLALHFTAVGQTQVGWGSYVRSVDRDASIAQASRGRR